MWLITESLAGADLLGRLPRSEDYRDGPSRRKRETRRHRFRLVAPNPERAVFYGVCYFADDAAFSDILRPLEEFGRTHGCSAIDYSIGRRWHRVPAYEGRLMDELRAAVEFDIREAFLAVNNIDCTVEADAEMIRDFIRYANAGAKE